MKKLFFTLILFSAFYGKAQQYTLHLTGSIDGNPPSTIANGSVDVLIDGALFQHYENNNAGADLIINDAFIVGSFISLSMEEQSMLNIGGFPIECQTSNINADNALTLLIQSHVSVGGCTTDLVAALIPNINEIIGSTEVLCMGEPLELGALPNSFPNVAYNWQYSFDNITWQDFPPEYNHQSSVSMTIEELLGEAHLDYLESDIHFRIGGYNKGAFSEVLTVSYSACGPLLESLTPDDLSCSYSTDGSFSAQFDRGLEEGQTLDVNLYFEEIGGLFYGATGLSLDEGHVLNWSEPLPPGTYYFAYGITGLNLSSYESFQITAPPPLTFNASGTDINCFGAEDGSIELTAEGGTGTYSYMLNGGTPVEFTTPYTLNDLPPGDYELQVLDENACIGNYDSEYETIFISLTEPDAPILVAGTVNDATGFELATGAIAVSVSGGTAPYSYLWNTGVTTEDLEDILAGTYEIMVTDANDCQYVAEFTVNEPEPLLIIIKEYSGAVCFEDTGGSISASASGGYPNYRYELFRETSADNFISTGDVLTTAGHFSVEGLSPGSYRIALIDNGGAGIEVLSDIVTISEASELVITNSSLSHALCSGKDTGSIDISVSGGTLPYSYHWNEGAYTTEDLNEVPPGVYSLVVSDANGCETPIQFFEIIGPDTETDIEFLMASQTFTRESLIIAEVSYPLPDQVEWILPEGVTVVEEDAEFIELVFETAGSYEVGMQAAWGDCVLTKTKTILILEGADFTENDEVHSQNNRIETFTVYPNPSNGNFSVQIVLKKTSHIRIKIFGLASNVLLADISAEGDLEYEIPVTLAPLPSGLYAVVLETPFGSQVRKLLVE